VALRARLTEHGAGRELAKQLGIDESAVSRWANGKLKPGTRMRARLEELFGIHWQLWDRSPAEEDHAEVA